MSGRIFYLYSCVIWIHIYLKIFLNLRIIMRMWTWIRIHSKKNSWFKNYQIYYSPKFKNHQFYDSYAMDMLSDYVHQENFRHKPSKTSYHSELWTRLHEFVFWFFPEWHHILMEFNFLTICIENKYSLSLRHRLGFTSA